MKASLVPQEIFLLSYENQQPFRTMGHDLLDDEECNFSNFFKLTLLACLAYNPAERPSARRLVNVCERAIAILRLDPGALQHANYTADLEALQRLSTDPAPRGLFTHPRYIGESPLGAGQHIDEIALGPGLSDVKKLISRPEWATLPPSPTHAGSARDQATRFQVPTGPVRVRPSIDQSQSETGKQVPSGKQWGSKARRQADDALPPTKRDLFYFNLQGRHPISGMTGARSST
jgi:hypothetical protein